MFGQLHVSWSGSCLVIFMYLGQAQVHRDDLNSFMNVDDKFKVKGLCDEIEPTGHNILLNVE